MMLQIADLCQRIVEKLTALGSPIEKYLQPGIPASELRQVQASIPSILPNSIVAMYKWRNGTRLSEGRLVEYFPGWRFDPLEESLERYAILADKGYPGVEELWKDHWFPIFSSHDISSYGIVCNDRSADDGEIVSYEYMLGSEVEFVSLEAMLQTILAAYDTGVYYVDHEGQLEFGDIKYDDLGNFKGVDATRFNEIARRFNPGLKQYD